MAGIWLKMLSTINEEKAFHEVVEQRHALQNTWHSIVFMHAENKTNKN